MKRADIKVEYIGHFGSDLSVVNAARVSFHKESKEFGTQDEKLINYLAKNKHFSPFNHAFISVRVKAPLFCARQLVKHRFMPWNEVSRRYVDEEPEFYFPDTWGKKAENVKQGSGERYIDDVIGRHEVGKMLKLYHVALHGGMAPEDARMFLPQNMMTEWVWSGTLGAFCDMLILRLDPHTQYQSRIVAEQVKKIVEEHFPVSLKARLEHA